jgi:hypothetical protein
MVSSSASTSRGDASVARREAQAQRAAARAATAAAREAAALEKALRQREAIEAEERDEQSVEAVVEWWRTLALPPPPLNDYHGALQPRAIDSRMLPAPPSKTQLSEPQHPRLEIDTFRTAHLAELERRLHGRRFRRIKFGHLVIGALGSAVAGGLVSQLAGAQLSAMLVAVLATCFITMMVLAMLGRYLERRGFRVALQDEHHRTWPDAEAAVRREHAARCDAVDEEFRGRVDAAESAYQAALSQHALAESAIREKWARDEQARIELLRKLIAGDADECTQVLAMSLESIEFPFETDVDFSVSDDGRAVQLLVDLPEIEDCIPETRVKALKNGTTKSVKRTRAERFGLYARLVVGLGVALATHAHCVLPSARIVTVAAYTQRRARGKGAIEDQFIYELTLSRDDAEDIDPGRTGSLELLQTLESRVDIETSGNFRKLKAPSWAPDVRALS